VRFRLKARSEFTATIAPCLLFRSTASKARIGCSWLKNFSSSSSRQSASLVSA
jgi:hypothetical protein